jgi:hypothetical protein
MITDEDGPLRVLWYLREALGGNQPDPSPGSAGDLISCAYCLSVWVALVFVLLMQLNLRAVNIGFEVLALSAVSVFATTLHNYVNDQLS